MKIVFIIGAARSGTHLLGSSISNVIEDSHYLAEINEFWNKYNKDSSVDFFEPDSLSIKEMEKIKSDFVALCPKNKNVLIEKTASNSLRVDLLARLFPDAYFINVVRNGNYVVESVVSKIEGNPNKITGIGKRQKVNVFYKTGFFCARLFEKISSSTFDITYFFKNFRRYASQSLDILGVTKSKVWGPSFTKIKFNDATTFAAAQWSRCVIKSYDDFTSSDVKFMTVHFEDIVDDPERESIRINEFLNCDYKNNWFDIKSGHRRKVKEIDENVCPEFNIAMNLLGYSSE